MCGDAPSPPSGTIPGNPPGGSAGGTGLCCACPANGALNSNGFGTYFTTTYSHSNVLTNKGRIAVVRTEDGGSVTVTKTFSLAYTLSANEADHRGVVTAQLTSAMSTWTSEAASFRVVVNQPGCQPQRLNIIYTTAIVASGADVAVTVNGQQPPPEDSDEEELRSFVTGGTEMNFFVRARGDNTWVMVHEVGHTMGLPDEYIYDHPSSTAPTVTYKAASNPDEVVTLGARGTPAADATEFEFETATIMGKDQSRVYPPRVFFWVAIEVKKLLQAAGVSAVVTLERA
jgi:hypothetical protein